MRVAQTGFVMMMVLASLPAMAGGSSLAVGLSLGGDIPTATPGDTDTAPFVDEDAGGAWGQCKPDSSDAERVCGVQTALQMIAVRADVVMRLHTSERSATRLGIKGEYGPRVGQVRFSCGAGMGGADCAAGGEESADFGYANGHWGYTIQSALTLGQEFSVPVRDSSLYFGAQGVAGVTYTMDSLGAFESGQTGSPTDGFDQLYEDSTGEPVGAFDSRSVVGIYGAELVAGFQTSGALFFEVGYGVTRVPASALAPFDASQIDTTPPGSFKIERAAFVWNPIRVGIGGRFDL